MFKTNGSTRNVTFVLHADIMKHCDDAIAIAFANRLSAGTIFDLLPAAVKGSLMIAFFNSGSAYPLFCTKLLYHHYSASILNQKLKRTLFSTPFGSGFCNCDTKQEIDNLDTLTELRSSSNVE